MVLMRLWHMQVITAAERLLEANHIIAAAEKADGGEGGIYFVRPAMRLCILNVCALLHAMWERRTVLGLPVAAAWSSLPAVTHANLNPNSVLLHSALQNAVQIADALSFRR